MKSELCFSMMRAIFTACLLAVAPEACLLAVAPEVSADEPWVADPALVASSAANNKDFNYEESRVPEYTLPDPLRGESGTLVVDAGGWPSRREETMKLFRSNVYGSRPTTDYRVTFEVTAEKQGLFELNATGRAVTVTISSGAEKFSFPMLVFLPAIKNSNRGSGIATCPAVIQIIIQDFPSLDVAITEKIGFWPVQDLLNRGYVACAVSTSAIDPDRADGFNDGLRGFFARAAGDITKISRDDAWKSLSAWGWGASRALDYLLTLDQVDKSKIALIGHSRGGKSALWAAAEDTRFAIVCSNNSGCGGAALSRRAYGETVARITKSFPHWFCDRFSFYAGRESELPIDQHQLIALIAPRPVYVTSAADDLWADPRGEYLSLVGAAPVYKLFGPEAIQSSEMPAIAQPRIEGKMGYHIRSGPHGLTEYDWDKYLDFCDKQWQRIDR